MIIDCISDLHGYEPALPGGDILIIAGDMTATDSVPHWVDFFGWLAKQRYKKVIFIGGNHDNFLAQCISGNAARDLNLSEDFPEIMEYLYDSSFECEGLKFYGTPYQPSFVGQNPICAAFSLDTEEELAEKFNKIDDDTDILITHGPMFGCLDQCSRRRVGSMALKHRISELPNLKFHVFGHIHEDGMNFRKREAVHINAAYVTEVYEERHKIMRVVMEMVEGKWEMIHVYPLPLPKKES